MNRLKAEALWPVIKAYAKGADVQWFNPDPGVDAWVDHGNPTFAFEYQWRVRPECPGFEDWWTEHHKGWPATEKDIAKKAWLAAINRKGDS